jgi:hypothetical protein
MLELIIRTREPLFRRLFITCSNTLNVSFPLTLTLSFKLCSIFAAAHFFNLSNPNACPRLFELGFPEVDTSVVDGNA